MTPDTNLTFDFLFKAAAFIMLLVNAVVLIRNNSKNSQEGIIKANVKLDGLCSDSRETRIDLKTMKDDITTMKLKQVEHGAHIDLLSTRVDRLEEKVDEFEL